MEREGQMNRPLIAVVIFLGILFLIFLFSLPTGTATKGDINSAWCSISKECK